MNFLRQAWRFFLALLQRADFYLGLLLLAILLYLPLAIWLPRWSIKFAVAALFILPALTVLVLFTLGPVILGIIHEIRSGSRWISWLAAPFDWMWRNWKNLVGIEIVIGLLGISLAFLPKEAMEIGEVPFLPVLISILIALWLLDGGRWRQIASGMLSVLVIAVVINASIVLWKKYSTKLDVMSPSGSAVSAQSQPVLDFQYGVASITVPPKGKSEPYSRPAYAEHFWWKTSGELQATCKFPKGSPKTVLSWENCRGVQEVQFTNPHDKPITVELFAQM